MKQVNSKKKKSNWKNWISFFDLYGAQPNLFIFGKQKYSSVIGIFCTFVAVFLTIAYLISQIQELVTQSLPQIVQSDHLAIETSSFPLDKSNFTLAVSVADINQNPLDKINQYFTISIQNCFRTRKLNNKTNSIEIPTIFDRCTDYPTYACSEEDFVSDLDKTFFSNIRLGTVQCIKKSFLENNPPKLQGLVSSNDYAYLTIKLQTCKNSTDNNNSCATTEEINKNLLNGYYVVYLSDTLSQMNKKGNAQEPIIKMQYTTFSIRSSKTIFQSFRIIQSTTNSGLVFDDINSDTFLVQQQIYETSTFYNDDYLIYHYIILDDIYTEYSRSYLSLFTILSRIGGLWQFIFLILGFLSKPFIQNEMNIKIANKLFRFEQNEDQALDVQRDSNVGSIKLNIDRLLKRENLKIPNKLLKIFLFSIGCGKSVIQQIHQANQKIQKKLDIVEIISSLQKYEKLKEIILDEDQKALFELIPDPIISNPQLEPEKQIDTRQPLSFSQQMFEGNQLDNKFDLACKSFINVFEKARIQQTLNSRIIQQLDPEMVKLFLQHSFGEQQFQEDRIKSSVRSQCKSPSSLSISQESSAAQVFRQVIHN